LDLGQSRESAENFPRGGQRKKGQKLAKNTEKQQYLPFPRGWGATKKDRKIAKKGQKITLFSFYLLYLYHV